MPSWTPNSEKDSVNGKEENRSNHGRRRVSARLYPGQHRVEPYGGHVRRMDHVPYRNQDPPYPQRRGSGDLLHDGTGRQGPARKDEYRSARHRDGRLRDGHAGHVFPVDGQPDLLQNRDEKRVRIRSVGRLQRFLICAQHGCEIYRDRNLQESRRHRSR